MIIPELMDSSLSEWEEKLVAILFLSGGKFRKNVFAAETVERIEAVLLKMEHLPLEWCKEICIEALLIAQGDRSHAA